MGAFIEKNLWEDSCRNRQAYPRIERDITTDVAVIGGGYSGLSAALRVAEKGASVALLEAHSIAYGGSGRNVGLVNAGLWLKPDEITTRLGQEHGEKTIRFLGDAPAQVFKLIDKYQIDCEASHIGTLHCAESATGRDDLLQRQQQWAKYDITVDVLDAQHSQNLLGTSAFCACLHDRRAGTIQPLSYAYGLAQAAARQGASIFCNSPVRSVERQGSHWLIKTGKGSVKAEKLISATGTYPQAHADYECPQTAALYFFQLATAPLSEALQQEILPQKHGIWDTHQILTSLRKNREGRLIVGSIGRLDGPSRAIHTAWAYRKMVSVYPQLKGQAFTHQWFGRIGLTRGNTPRIAAPHPDWLSVWGYNGRGIAPGTAFGRLIADIHLSGDQTLSPIPYYPMKRERFIAAQSFGIEFGAAAYHAGKAFMIARKNRDLRRSNL